eukprot:g1873.t1
MRRRKNHLVARSSLSAEKKEETEGVVKNEKRKRNKITGKYTPRPKISAPTINTPIWLTPINGISPYVSTTVQKLRTSLWTGFTDRNIDQEARTPATLEALYATAHSKTRRRTFASKFPSLQNATRSKHRSVDDMYSELLLEHKRLRAQLSEIMKPDIYNQLLVLRQLREKECAVDMDLASDFSARSDKSSSRLSRGGGSTSSSRSGSSRRNLSRSIRTASSDPRVPTHDSSLSMTPSKAISAARELVFSGRKTSTTFDQMRGRLMRESPKTPFSVSSRASYARDNPSLQIDEVQIGPWRVKSAAMNSIVVQFEHSPTTFVTNAGDETIDPAYIPNDMDALDTTLRAMNIIVRFPENLPAAQHIRALMPVTSTVVILGVLILWSAFAIHKSFLVLSLLLAFFAFRSFLQSSPFAPYRGELCIRILPKNICGFRYLNRLTETGTLNIELTDLVLTWSPLAGNKFYIPESPRLASASATSSGGKSAQKLFFASGGLSSSGQKRQSTKTATRAEENCSASVDVTRTRRNRLVARRRLAMRGTGTPGKIVDSVAKRAGARISAAVAVQTRRRDRLHAALCLRRRLLVAGSRSDSNVIRTSQRRVLRSVIDFASCREKSRARNPVPKYVVDGDSEANPTSGGLRRTSSTSSVQSQENSRSVHKAAEHDSPTSTLSSFYSWLFPRDVNHSGNGPIAMKNQMLTIKFEEPLIPSLLKRFVLENDELIPHCESGLPGWSIFLVSYGLFYRREMRHLFTICVWMASLIMMAVGLFDLFRTFPAVHSMFSWLLGNWFAWFEEAIVLRTASILTFLLPQAALNVFWVVQSTWRGASQLAYLFISLLRAPFLVLQTLLTVCASILRPIFMCCSKIGAFGRAATPAVQSSSTIFGVAWRALVQLWTFAKFMWQLFRNIVLNGISRIGVWVLQHWTSFHKFVLVRYFRSIVVVGVLLGLLLANALWHDD